MNEAIYQPKGPLSQVIKYIWYNDGYTPQSLAERVLPGSSFQIIINLGERRFCHFHTSDLKHPRVFDDVILTGLRTHPIYLDSYSRISTMGAVLQEGAVPVLFQIPASEFRNQVVSLGEIEGSDFSEWKQKLNDLPTISEKFRLLEMFFKKMLKEADLNINPALQASINQIKVTNGTISISEVIDKTGYSRRWFSELFRNTVGVNPKKYARLCRFQKSLSILRNESVFKPAATALRCGYFDQAHFIHDFRDFAGISPSEYYREQGESANHLVI